MKCKVYNPVTGTYKID